LASSASQEECSVPRLSIIIPYRQQDQRLEATLLSVLENRPEDCEIVVVHDGSYADPYNLADEAIFVEVAVRSNIAQLLNAGVMAACSPAVCVLLDGASVAPGWCEAPLSRLLSTQAVAVAVPVRYGQSRRLSYGIDLQRQQRNSTLRRGRFESTRENPNCCGPALVCGFYRRKALLALGGWNESLPEAAIDLDLAWMLNALGIQCECDASTEVFVDGGSITRPQSWTLVSSVASLFVAHGGSASIFSSLKGLLLEVCQGRPLASAAWCNGLRDASTIRQTQLRIAHAKQQLTTQQEDEPCLRIFDAGSHAANRFRRIAA
jgi:hypothetical protein